MCTAHSNDLVKKVKLNSDFAKRVLQKKKENDLAKFLASLLLPHPYHTSYWKKEGRRKKKKKRRRRNLSFIPQVRECVTWQQEMLTNWRKRGRREEEVEKKFWQRLFSLSLFLSDLLSW